MPISARLGLAAGTAHASTASLRGLSAGIARAAEAVATCIRVASTAATGTRPAVAGCVTQSPGQKSQAAPPQPQPNQTIGASWQSVAPPNAKDTMANITARIKTKLAQGDKDVQEDDTQETDEGDTVAHEPSAKKPRVEPAPTSRKKAPASKKKVPPPMKVATTSKKVVTNSRKPAPTPPTVRKKPARFMPGRTAGTVTDGRDPNRVEDTLEFKSPSTARKPRYYKSATIYNDRKRKLWRLKEAPGRRDETFYYDKTEPKQAWEKLVRDMKRLAK